MILGTSWDIYNDTGIFCSLPISYLKVVWLLFWLFFQVGYWSQKSWIVTVLVFKILVFGRFLMSISSISIIRNPNLILLLKLLC